MKKHISLVKTWTAVCLAAVFTLLSTSQSLAIDEVAGEPEFSTQDQQLISSEKDMNVDVEAAADSLYGIVIYHDNRDLDIGKTKTLTCKAYYDATSYKNDTGGKVVSPTWSISSGTSYASISSSGVLTGKARGTVTVKASYTENGVTKTASGNMYIHGPVSLSITTDASDNTVMRGSTINCICTVKYDTGISKILTPNWSIDSGSSYASINAAGVLTGKAYGSATVKASYTEGGTTVTDTLRVYVDELYSIEISGASSVYVGDTVHYSCTARYHYAQKKVVNASWSISSGDSYASISSDGALTGLKDGWTEVKATYTEGGVTKTKEMSVRVYEVTYPVTSISINGIDSVMKDGTATYTCIATRTDGSSSSVTPTWSITSGGGSASISSGGVLTGTGAGMIILKAVYAGKTAEKSIMIIDVGAVAPSITTQPKSQTVNEGSSVTFSVTASGTAPLKYQWKKNGTPISGATSSSYTISSLKTSDAGSYTVTVSNSAGDLTSSVATLTVNVPVTLSSISISGSDSVNVGSTATYTCTATYSNGTTKTVTPTWSISSGGSYASITSGGVLTGKADGTATVKAAYEGKTATKSVTVCVSLSSISISGSTSVNVESTATYTCTATYSNGTTKTVTPTWSISSGTSYASITSGGVLTGKKAIRTVTVQATYSEGGVTKTATLSVVVLMGVKITTQPMNQTVNEGDSVTFSVVAESLVNLDMIRIEPGTFTMGNSDYGPVHQVTLSKGFWLGKYEVTQAQYETVMGSKPASIYGAGDNYPVYHVTWHDATNFCAKLNAQEKAAGRLPYGYEYTLPTEAQWEYACRAGTTGDYNVNGAALSGLGWYSVNSDSKPHLVGQKKPNLWGLYDMHGNVREWCLDWYGKYLTSAVTDPTGPETGEYRMLRGGSWGSNASGCRSAARNSNHPSYSDSYCGFRVALAPVQSGSGSFLSYAEQMSEVLPEGEQAENGGPLATSGAMSPSWTAVAAANVAAGEDFSIPVGGALTYQWYKDGVAISGATGSSYTIKSVKAGDAGKYTVKVSNNAGSVTSSAATLTVNVPVTLSSITISGSSSVSVGSTATYTCTATYSNGTTKTVIPTWSISSGTSYASITSGGVLTGKAAGTATVKASYSEGGVTKTATKSVTVNASFTYHPADTDKDKMIKITEVTAYGKAWKNGETWSVAPNPIPIAYLTRAGALWKGGETYYQNKTQEAPMCWVNGEGYIQVKPMPYDPPYIDPMPIVTLETEVEAASDSAVYSAISGEMVTITVTPGSGVLVYAVEDTIPSGLTVTGINESGVYDSVNHKVKWGPWFDNSTRTLTYTLVIPDDFSGMATLNGTASFDGEDTAITGDRDIRILGDSPDALSIRKESDGTTVTITFTGTLQESTDMKTWKDVTDVSPYATIIGKEKKFYRSVR